MLIKRCDLVNFCQHKEKKIKFTPGLNAIIGANGSGKSNILKAIYGAITGDFSRNQGLKVDNVCKDISKNDPSYVYAELEHNNNLIMINRYLQPNNSNLSVYDTSQDPVYELALTKTTEINESLESLLGVDSAILNHYVFVDQWAMFDFISMTPSERAKVFQRLFKTDNLAQLYKLIGDHTAKIEVPKYGIDKDKLQQHLKELEVQIEEKELELDLYEAFIDNFGGDITELENVVKLYEEAKGALNDVKHLQCAENETSKEIKRLEDKISLLVNDYTAFNNKITNQFDKYIKYKGLLENLTVYKQYKSNKDQINEEIIRLTFVNLLPPCKPSKYIKFPQHSSEDIKFWNEYDTVKNLIITAEKILSIVSTNDPECPVCGTDISELDVNAIKSKLIEDKARLVQMDNIITQSVNYDLILRNYNNERNLIDAKLKDAMESLNNLQKIAIPEIDENEESIRHFIADYEETKTCVATVLQDIQTWQAKLAKECRCLADIQKTLKQSINILSKANHITSEHYAQTISLIKDYKNNLQQKVTVVEVINILNQQYIKIKVQLEDIERREKITKIDDDWISHCLEMRNVLHHDNLPKIIALNHLNVLQHEINNILIAFDCQFRIHTDIDLSFIVEFNNGKKIPAARLSGGEKVLLALAFRVAVNEVFAKDLGLLILDEPTAGLDESNLACLKIAIDRLKQITSSRGLQVIIVTHERDLYNLFDNVIYT